MLFPMVSLGTLSSDRFRNDKPWEDENSKDNFALPCKFHRNHEALL